MKKKIFILFFLAISSIVLANDNDKIAINSFFEKVNRLDFKSAENFILSTTNKVYNKRLKTLLALYKKEKSLNFKHDSEFGKTTFYASKAIDLLIRGYFEFNTNNKALAFKYFDNALVLSQDNKQLELFCLISILNVYVSKSIQSNNEFQKYLQILKNNATTNLELLYYYSFKFKLLSQTETYDTKKTKNKDKFDQIFINYDSVAKTFPNSNKTLYRYHLDKGNYLIKNKPNEAELHYKKSLNLLDNDVFYKSIKKILFFNFARLYEIKKNYPLAFTYLNKAKLLIEKDSHVDFFALHTYKANIFKKMNVLDSALFYEKEAKYNQIKWGMQKQNTEISKIQVQLETAEKEKENIELKAKRKQDKLIIVIGTIFVILGSVITYLNLKNSRKKRLLAEQQKELEKQKSLTLIKEQEINSINAMIDGQEKERIRIAEDLHDNIGSVLATLKLHFENLKLNREKEHFDQDELYAKTEKLIDETYLKVRSIAHAKNAGVIANKGLLVAVKLMAEKISDANKIAIHVLDFGLNKRLENQLEITIFRIIQELITNIIKHANATEATINISLFDKNLNIIIEDNGQGFDYDKINLKNSMGISSIQTRIKHLKGSFEVDSTIDKGTSIILNIPV
ncbi:sensor histidine kinase [Tenacibaculum aiptasiae]|uniref:sensor histidine kinase n=1 Tax=Tenacibaculum aiptasiae TaxID=426481 RepID=UPI002330F89E|nr:sensor histidine kinase [Tenacibaculum aiptasiae]